MPVRKSWRAVWVFFYGSFMNRDVLARAGVRPAMPQRARLDGWDIRIRPRATLVPSPRRSVHGVLAKVTHTDITKLYTKDWFGFGTYLPEAVIVTGARGRRVPAMCYIAWQMKDGTPSSDYLQKIVSTALEFRFPRTYLQRIRSFAP
jgi:hypothetical protein